MSMAAFLTMAPADPLDVAARCGHRVLDADACRFTAEEPVLVCRQCCPYCTPGRERSAFEQITAAVQAASRPAAV